MTTNKDFKLGKRKVQLNIKKPKTHSMSIFDFDDTLVTSYHHPIYLTDINGVKRTLNREEFIVYEKVPGDVFDFSSLDNIKSEHKIEPVWNLFLESLSKSDLNMDNEVHQHTTIVLSARRKIEPVVHFLEVVENTIPNQIVGLAIDAGTNNGLHKSQWIKELSHIPFCIFKVEAGVIKPFSF